MSKSWMLYNTNFCIMTVAWYTVVQSEGRWLHWQAAQVWFLPVPFFYGNLFLQFTTSYVIFFFLLFMNLLQMQFIQYWYKANKVLFKKRHIHVYCPETRAWNCDVHRVCTQFSASEVFNYLFFGSQVFCKVISSIWNSYKL